MSARPMITYLQDSAAHKLLVHNAVGTTAPPTLISDGAAYLGAWRDFGSFLPRRAAARFVGSGALNLTAISVWCYFDGSWSKIGALADIAFIAGDLSRTYVFDFPVGSRIAFAFTASAGSVTVHAFPLESFE